MNKLLKLVLIALLVSFTSTAVLAADTEDQAVNTAEPEVDSETPPGQQPQTEDGEPQSPRDAENAPVETGVAVKPIKEFKPTEQIEADSAVSFPVDI